MTAGHRPFIRLTFSLAATLALGLVPGCGTDGAGNDTQMADAAPGLDLGADASQPVDAVRRLDIGDDASPAHDDAAPTPDAAGHLDLGPDAAVALEAPGPYHVGYRQSEVTYVPPGADTPRTLRLALWYPTDDETGSPTRYTFGGARPGVFSNAGLHGGDALPLMVFSHGSGGLAEQSYFLTEFFASHGFVVAAPDHTGNTFTDANNVPPEMFYLRPLDITAVLDFVYSPPDGDPLAGRLSDKVVMAGHSFGGYTTLADTGTAYNLDVISGACDSGVITDDLFCNLVSQPDIRDLFTNGFVDDRIDVGIPMAPVGGAAFDFAPIDVPTLLVTAGADETLPDPQHGDDVWSKLDGAQDVRLGFPHAGHFSFSDICKAVPGLLEGDGCGADNTDTDEVHRVVNAVSWAFVRRNLLDDRSHDVELDAVLDGTTPLSDAATVTPKE